MRQFLTSSTSLSTILIIWSCVIKMKRFLPVMGTVSVWAMVYNVSAKAVAPSKAVKITAFCWCGSSFQWSLRRLKIFTSNFNAYLLISFIDFNLLRKCLINRFIYSVWKFIQISYQKQAHIVWILFSVKFIWSTCYL